MIKIAKFGGSSVADAEHFKKIKAIVDADPARRFVVVSACGRRFKGDTKVTDLLYLVNAASAILISLTSWSSPIPSARSSRPLPSAPARAATLPRSS